ncbi:MAG: NADH-quinone oxidoreductase subunit NuoH [Nitriliruptoraceae bacterium]|nr:NADH-quinone oxidoreductase subunit NuoH [Nitriliruptoraceae bacterium]
METPLWVPLLQATVVFTYYLLLTALLIWAERRVVARMQSRLGPNRVGPFGILQTLVDGVKMFFKEDTTPGMVNRSIFTVAPLIGVIAGFLSIAVIPIGGEVTLFGETFTLVVADLSIGVLWVLAMGSIHVYSVFLGGWASNSPYPLLGGIRSSAQMVSYEIAQGLAVASVIIYAGSLRVSDIVAGQAGSGFADGVPGWYAIPLFPAFMVFVIGMVAEAGRPPFDLAEAEGELVGGFNTEYSGLRFGMFMLAEFMSVVTMSAIVVTLFLGGPSGPTFGAPEAFAGLIGTGWFLLKMVVFIFFFILLRGALPRYRYDRLMDLGWKVLIPVALVWTLVTAAFVILEQEQPGLGTDLRLTLASIAAVIVGWLLFSGREPRDAGDGLDRHEPAPGPVAAPTTDTADDGTTPASDDTADDRQEVAP